MTHCILVKFVPEITDKAALCAEIEGFYADTGVKEGVKSVTLRRCCVDRANRYDLLIELEMDKDDLPVWDASAKHAEWKARYGEKLASKAIFDFE